MNVSYFWLANTGESLCKRSLKNVTYEFVFTSSVGLAWMACEMGGKWSYSCSFVGCSFQDLNKLARSILVLFPLAFSPRVSFESRWCIQTVVLIRPQVRRNSVLFYERSDFPMIPISLAVHAFSIRMLISLSVNKIKYLKFPIYYLGFIRENVNRSFSRQI